MENRENRERELSREEMAHLMAKIEKSAEEIRVPESLTPEAVKEKLRGQKPVRMAFPRRRLVEAAAVAAMAVLLGGTGLYAGIRGSRSMAADQTGSGSADGNVEYCAQPAAGEPEAGNELEEAIKKKPVVGNFYLASGYEDVYAVFRDNTQKYLGSVIFKEEAEVDGAETAIDDAAGIIAAGGIYDLDGSEASRDSITANTSESSSAGKDYSKTNLQVEGVDESDFVKNDGSYLYVQSGRLVRVVDIRNDKMEVAAEIEPELGTSGSICDMYVDGNRMYLILQKREAKLNVPSADAVSRTEGETAKEDGSVDEVPAEEKSVSNADRAETEDAWSYQIEADDSVELVTYDISDRNNAKYMGKVVQDGSYQDSRKVGRYIYLFSQKNPYTRWQYGDRVDVEEESSVSDETLSKQGLIPCINGKLAEADCIYVQDNASSELIVSSVDTDDPSNVVDHMVLLNDYAQIYMSTDAIYLYAEDYKWDQASDEGRSCTDVAKFSYKNGVLDGVGAVTLRGSIMDKFAISEGGGILRVLTTEWSANSKNQLYLLDENLNETGTLEGIAPGEEIYAARFIGDVAYFITYHNTDPLFAVDISDPSNPKMLGQLKITGFSDYLHPYGDGMLLGIGYETDPETSERLGVKIVMFDISDPADLKVLDTVTLKGTYCNAASDYKCALADAGKNLIGFSVTDWASDTGQNYYLYAWEDGKFVQRFKEAVGESWNESLTRGLYAGSRFYLLHPEREEYRLRSYDMEDGYRMLDELKMKDEGSVME